ncbi:MAG: hypothetical protein ACI8UO_004043 [Verrucomicrobiales bacterium]|jgi:hypothetical protein
MRVISKDRIGTPGALILQRTTPGNWVFQVWDDVAKKWALASWQGDLSDGEWHQLVGVVDPARKKVQLYVDGELRAEAAWSAATLDDSDKADLVIGADSGEAKFGQTFHGSIRSVRFLQGIVEQLPTAK